ncbi:response regulator transcription factor [Telmatospirillum sp. J64-1]|uniref:response regulator transcription factor n=1 Tax=Telmatospirillum sp. J64-1 TaxID=2502183 RepID=UPI00115DEC53|nr:response regulator transcription factor [Telmatospirillum sp. J64-1]
MGRILVVEDEMTLRQDLIEHLTDCGHEVDGAGSGPEMDCLLEKKIWDLVLLDVNLPGEDGFRIAARLRRQSQIGIIMMTARGLTVDRVVGLEMGADAYMVKPVDLRELQAQVGTLLRRLGNDAPLPRPPAQVATSVPDFAERTTWIFDAVGWTLQGPSGACVTLTATEKTFLSLLAARPGTPVSRNDIFAALGKRHWSPGDRSIDSLVRRLRSKVEKELGIPLPVQSVHGIGYAFAAPITLA